MGKKRFPVCKSFGEPYAIKELWQELSIAVVMKVHFKLSTPLAEVPFSNFNTLRVLSNPNSLFRAALLAQPG